MSEDLDRLAEAYGISLGYVDEAGAFQRVSERAKQRILAALGVSARTRNEIVAALAAAPASEPLETTTAAGPTCYVPEWLKRGRAWGITCQLYGLRSERNWGIGDFEDLARLAEYAGSLGADFLGVSPLHALFLADPGRRSPYSPSSRRFLNPLYIAIDGLGGGDRAKSEAVTKARAATLLDYTAVGEAKRAAFAARFSEFQRQDLARGTPSARLFERFCSERGDALELFARYEALSSVLASKGFSCGWRSWPEQYKSPASTAVARFAREEPESILFHKWLQWVAHGQLSDAQRRARAAGMRIGLFLDLAIGVAPDGADTWAAPDSIVSGIHVGSPPDAFNPRGQDWGLSPLSPAALRERNGAPLLAILRDTMQFAGAIRIDHVLGFERLYWVPEGLTAGDGAYVTYPRDLLLEQLASASQEFSALVIGEDLGTVSAGFRDVMLSREIHGYRVLYFERGERGFRAPSSYAPVVLASVSTHDLPTLSGWWRGRDISERERLGLIDSATASSQRHLRERHREHMLEALRRAGAVSNDVAASSASAELPGSILIGVHRFLARTRSRLVALQLEDLVGMEEQANLPGTVDQHPNWRRTLPITLEELPRCNILQRVVCGVTAERPRAP